MAEYRYTHSDRIEQLRTLELALLDLIPVARGLGIKEAARYEWALGRTRWLIANGYTQDDPTGLGRQVPDAFLRHKDWMPPLELQADGSWQEPAWFRQLEEKLHRTLRAAGVLPVLGFH